MNYPFLLFGGNDKPKGGASDFVSAWTSAHECESEALRLGLVWWQAAAYSNDGTLTVTMGKELPPERATKASRG